MNDAALLSTGRAAVGRRGPKARLSSTLIVEQACALLNEMPLEEFTLAKLARSLNAGVMSIYTYFPSRDALLDAVTEEILTSFEVADAGSGRWQDIMLDRLWATQRLIQRHPVVTKVIFRDGHHSPVWLKKWWLPVAQLFRDEGLDDQHTAFAMRWFATAAMGIIVTQIGAPQRSLPSAEGKLDTLSRPQRLLARDLWDCLADVELHAVLDFGFRNIILGVEALLHDTNIKTNDQESGNGHRI